MKKKFVIFSQSRSGSTLLKDLIDSHPSIHCEGEILALSEGYITNRFVLKLCRRIPVPYIYFRKSLSQNEIYGFTLFTYHTPHIKQCLYSLSRLGWRIIYLKRLDIVNQAISSIIALRSQYFHNIEGVVKPKKINFEITEDEFLSAIKKRIDWRQKESITLKNIDHLTVYYEKDLEQMNCWQPAADKIFKHLNIASVAIHSGLQNTYSKPYSELINNYHELIDLLNDSEISESLTGIWNPKFNN